MKSHRALETRSLVAVYGGMALLAALADWIWRDDPWIGWQVTWPTARNLWAIGIAYVVISLLVGAFCMSFFRWGQELEKVFQQILTPFSYLQIVLLALLSGFVEEWFFRSVLSTHLGIIVSAIFFGLAHLLPARRVWLWSLWAFGSGIVLGLLYRHSASLYFVASLHAAVNFFFLLRLNNSAHRSATRYA